MTTVFMFPGQNSRYAGMLPKLAGMHAPNAELLVEASDLLGRNLFGHYSDQNAQAYASNRDVQVGVFLANHMYLQILEDSGVEADLSLGLSLGEWNHLVHIGALDFCDALRAVEQRGLIYDRGPRGLMASVFPMELDELKEVVERVRRTGVIEVVNLNAPRQHVMAGAKEPLDQALQILEEEFFVHTTVIDDLPMHSSLFEPVGRRFRAVLEELPFRQPRLPYLPNRLGHFAAALDNNTFVELLSSHVCRPTLFRQSIDHILGIDPDAVFVEVGPKKVLHNLMDKKWRKGPKLHVDHKDQPDEHLRDVISKLQRRTFSN